MIVEVHRDFIHRLCGSIICRKNKPNKLKNLFRAFNFLNSIHELP